MPIPRSVLTATIATTALAVIVSVGLTAAAIRTTIGFDIESSVAVWTVWSTAMVVAVVVPSILVPLTTWELTKTVLELHRTRSKLIEIAKHDDLTGLLNRRGFCDAARILFERARHERQTVAVLMCDIDHFKRVNDAHGHDVGDKAIRTLADVLKARVGQERDAVLGRHGGEEFVVVLAGLTLRDLVVLAEQLRAGVERGTLVVDGVAVPMTLSIGMAIDGQQVEDLGSLLKRADRALYKAKASGRNRVEIARQAA